MTQARVLAHATPAVYSRIMDFFELQKKLVEEQKATAKPAGKPAPAADALTVSQLTSQIERALAGAFPGSVRVLGEVSNFKAHSASGHLYFTLKDASACINCVMFRSEAARLKFSPEDGMELIATGRISLYAQRGQYQLYLTRLEPMGQGALQLAFQQLHDKLKAQGLFAPQRKKPIPAYPATIAIVTSTQTAAIQDIFKVLRRFGFLRLVVYHVPVQGEGAGQQIAAAITDLGRQHQKIGGIDVILLARGGGSLEDLWAFNEEVVARAVAACPIPIVTGIGHEVDVSIADLVADHHAHTPTEAAQVATRNWRNAAEIVEQAGQRLRREARNRVEKARQTLAAIEKHVFFERPLDRINAARQFLDDRQRAMQLALAACLRREQTRLTSLAARLEANRPSAVLLRMRQQFTTAQQRLWRGWAAWMRTRSTSLMSLSAALARRHPGQRVRFAGERLADLAQRLDHAAAITFARSHQAIVYLTARLNAIGPEQVLGRGYSITTSRRTGKVIRSATEVHGGDRLVTRLGEGKVESTADDPKQPTLF
ncbi:MAG: exodeoxyribonuclease VII large subunit [Tepidisphaerales bacterium]